ncbi:MAG: domain containing protein [Pedosphaera sp.]|nr:domain containing protein [Pedosphaera sp.]
MVQLKVLSGKMAGTEVVARHFPFRIGRSAAADFRVEEDGVWEEHLALAFDSQAGFVLTAQPNALAAINGQPFQEAVLRNGDSIEIGALKIRFWLGETRQGSLRLREWLTWTAFVLITAAQLGLIYWLVR